MLVDPMGVVRLDLGPAAGLGVGDVDTAYTATVRAALPCLANRADGPVPCRRGDRHRRALATR